MAHSKASDSSWRALLYRLEDAAPFEEEWVLLPEADDPVFLRYNALQAASGFDLSPYAEKTVLRKTYLHPAGQTDWRVNLLFDGDVLIGGDYMSIQPGGEMLPLSQIPRSIL